LRRGAQRFPCRIHVGLRRRAEHGRHSRHVAQVKREARSRVSRPARGAFQVRR
jgi:hypothetical protein